MKLQECSLTSGQATAYCICDQCRSGWKNRCQVMQITGIHRDNGFSDFLTVPFNTFLEMDGKL